MHFYPANDPFNAPELQRQSQSAWIDDYRLVMKKLNLSRFVAVQSMLFGFDNSAMLKAMAAFNDDDVRGIVIIPTDEVTDENLNHLHRKNIRGIRAFMLENPVYAWSELPKIARSIEPFGWHLQLQIDGRNLPDLSEKIQSLPCPVVIDHNGKFLDPVKPEDPSFQTLLKLLDTDNVWVKMSAPYETSKLGPPHYDDVSVLAKALAAHRPDRLVWATNFPHPGFMPPPNDMDLMKLLEQWVPDAETRKRILVDNPEKLYEFASIRENIDEHMDESAKKSSAKHVR